MTKLTEEDFPALSQIDSRLAVAAEMTQEFLLAAQRIAKEVPGINASPETVTSIAQTIATTFYGLVVRSKP